jgi:SMODS-associated and fused to various effectors sensor domain
LASRGTIPEVQSRRVWAASAGRCAICGADLLEGRLTHAPLTLGELAHIVGATTGEGSPRGQAGLSAEGRNKAENLMLICAGEHDEIDRAGASDVLTIERLTAIKRDHEDWVHRVTGLDRNRGTVVLRVIGAVRGNPVELSRPTASATVLNCDGRFPDFPLSLERDGIEIDLRQIAGEAEPSAAYWQSAKDKIDEVISHKLDDGIRQGKVAHLSVFAFARLPLLIYLGSRLDDTVETAIYQRHRSSETWDWIDDAEVDFVVEVGPAPDQTAKEAVLILNVSGSIQVDEMPAALLDLPRLTIHPATTTPSPDVVSSAQALRSFERTVREVLSEIEATAKAVERLHVFAALPMSAGVVLGRVHDPQVHPTLVVYNRGVEGYSVALEVAR